MYLEIIRELEGTPEMDTELALYNKVGDLYIKVHQVNAAVEMYERAVERYTVCGYPNNAIALCNKILRGAPGRTNVYLQLARLMLQRGFVAEAKKNFVEYAERMASAGKLEEAFEALKSFADLSPENEEIRLMLAEQLKASARDDEAREQIDKLIAQMSGAGETSRELMDRVHAVDPEYDLDHASLPDRNAGDLVFISLEDDAAARAGAESPLPPSEPVEIISGFDVDETPEVTPDDVTVPVLEGLDSGSEIESSGELDVVELDIEPTDLGVDAEAALADLPTVPVEPLGADTETAVADLPTVPVEPVEAKAEEMVAEVEIIPSEPEFDVAEGPDVSGGAATVPMPPAVPSIGDLEEQVADDPDDPVRHHRLAEVLLEGGQRDRGIEELSLTAQLYERREDWGQAARVTEEILRVQPGSIPHYQKQVEYAYRSGDRPRLITAYLSLADGLFRGGQLDRAEAIYRRVLEHDPDNALARAGLQSVAPPEPEPAPPPVAAPEPTAPPAPPRRTPARGRDYVDLGDFILGEDDAGKDTRMRIQEDAPTGDEEHDFSQMLQQFKRGIEENLDEADAQAHYDLGVAFKEMGLLDEAIAEFQKSLRGDDMRLQSAEMLGHCFFEKGQFEVAGTVLRRAIDTDTGPDQDKIALLYWLGRCEEENGRPDRALVSYQRVFAVDIRFEDVERRVQTLVKAGN